MFFFNDIRPIGNNTENSFDSIKQIDANGNEFWYARDLQAILEYTKWDNFLNVIEKAKIATSGKAKINIIGYQVARYEQINKERTYILVEEVID